MKDKRTSILYAGLSILYALTSFAYVLENNTILALMNGLCASIWGFTAYMEYKG